VALAVPVKLILERSYEAGPSLKVLERDSVSVDEEFPPAGNVGTIEGHKPTLPTAMDMDSPKNPSRDHARQAPAKESPHKKR